MSISAMFNDKIQSTSLEQSNKPQSLSSHGKKCDARHLKEGNLMDLFILL